MQDGSRVKVFQEQRLFLICIGSGLVTDLWRLSGRLSSILCSGRQGEQDHADGCSFMQKTHAEPPAMRVSNSFISARPPVPTFRFCEWPWSSSTLLACATL